MVRGVRMTRGTIEGGTTISLAGVEGASEDRPREIGLQTPAFHNHTTYYYLYLEPTSIMALFALPLPSPRPLVRP